MSDSTLPWTNETRSLTSQICWNLRVTCLPSTSLNWKGFTVNEKNNLTNFSNSKMLNMLWVQSSGIFVCGLCSTQEIISSTGKIPEKLKLLPQSRKKIQNFSKSENCLILGNSECIHKKKWFIVYCSLILQQPSKSYINESHSSPMM